MTQTARSRLDQLAGRWAIDPAHSSFDFIAKHMMVSKVRGSFGEFEGIFTVDLDGAKSSAEVRLKTASVDTKHADRDTHLRSPDFFDVEKFPEITFRSTGVELISADESRMTGDLTIKEVTRPVTLDVIFDDYVAKDAFGSARAGFSASTKVNREDFGLTWNVALETGGVLVSKEITLDLQIAATRIEA
ncbi:MAG: YceI family protein [Actinobacteria bacterium]|nr:YceI family protein [Actinomycetota bacterium]